MNHLNSVNTEQEQPQFSADQLPALLGKVSSSEEHNCLQIVYNSLVFFMHFNEGQLVYATNSLAPFERLERHLRRLSNQNPQITNPIIKQPRLTFKNDLRAYSQFPTDYQGIISLLEAGYLTSEEAVTVIRRITREVFESLLCLSNTCQYSIVSKSEPLRELCRFDVNSYMGQCQTRIEAWQAFAEQISSSYERPYLVSVKDKVIGNLNAEQNESICKLLKGLNFRQIAAVIDRDELVVAKILYPSILDNTIVVRAPKSPFDQLPNLPPRENIFETAPEANWRGEDSDAHVNIHSKQTVLALENTCKVAYVDNDLTAQQNLANFLEQNLFSVLAIEDAMSAFGELMEFQPSVVLLSVEMPELNGYELCTLLKNHHDFQSVPIVMVNETPELINLQKSKRAGAIANLAKPFEREEILNVIWQHIQ